MMDKKLFTKADVLLLVVLLVLGILIPRLFVGKVDDTKEAKLVITVDGNVAGEYSLKEDRTICIVPDYEGFVYPIEFSFLPQGYNAIKIEDGKAYVVDADCNGKDCVHSKAISKPGEVIACLPHKLLLTIVQKEDQTDVVVY